MGTQVADHRPVGSSTYVTPHGMLAFGGRCLVMGILNVTPDSFSDGGAYASADAAVRRALAMAEEGADVIDIGGESTRPGSKPVAASEQRRRVIPVIEAARARGLSIPVSIDTRSAEVAAAALDAGADIVNDVSAGRHDAAMPGLLARRRPVFVAMHMLGTPETMQRDPQYKDVVREVWEFFIDRAQALAAAGVDASRMIVDPGIGFGKKTEHNLELLREIRKLRVRWPVLVGASRKRFIGELLGIREPKGRDMGTAAVVAHCALAGAEMVRVHEVREMRQVVEICAALGRVTGR